MDLVKTNMACSRTRSGRCKIRPDTPMPKARHCTNCSNRHGVPTEKKCSVMAAAQSATPDKMPTSQLVVPLCKEEIQAYLGNCASSSPVQLSAKNAVFDNPLTGPRSLNFLADTMAILYKNMQSMQSELWVLPQERCGNHSDSWQQLQGIHDSSRLNNVNNVVLSDLPPRLEPILTADACAADNSPTNCYA